MNLQRHKDGSVWCIDWEVEGVWVAADTDLIGLEAASLHAMLVERQHAILQAHCNGNKEDVAKRVQTGYFITILINIQRVHI